MTACLHNTCSAHPAYLHLAAARLQLRRATHHAPGVHQGNQDPGECLHGLYPREGGEGPCPCLFVLLARKQKTKRVSACVLGECVSVSLIRVLRAPGRLMLLSKCCPSAWTWRRIAEAEVLLMRQCVNAHNCAADRGCNEVAGLCRFNGRS